MKDLFSKKVSLLLICLGLWLCMAPFAFGCKEPLVLINDLICGFLVLIAGTFSFQTGKKQFAYFCATIGFWLQLAPLFFWTKESVFYLNDTLSGMILLFTAFSFPKMADQEGELETPPGWSFNPSSFGPRSVTVFLALICWLLGRYLAAYQLGYIDHIYDPFFGDGSQKVVSSSVAKFFPVSDAGLGAFGYSLEFLFGWIGSERRWKTMPWLTVCFAALVVPAGMISILLIVLQPVLVGAWCGICLLIGSCMIVMVLLTVPEMVAVLQVLNKARKNKQLWNVFWNGDKTPKSSPVMPIQRTRTSELGFTLPWNLIASAFLGIWLMASTRVFQLQFHAADSNYIVGPLLFAVSVLSCNELIRSFRFFNFFLAAILVFAAFFEEGFTMYGKLNTVASALLVFLLNIPKKENAEVYGKKI